MARDEASAKATGAEAPLERYFRALEAVAVAREGASVSYIATACDLPLGTAHRLLQNLLRAGLLENRGGVRKDYRIGDRLLRLMHAGVDEGRIAILVQPILNRLANQFGETCYLARLAGHKVVSIAWAAPSDGLRGHVVPGYTLAPHVAASAKAILAFQPAEVIDLALKPPLARLTPETKTTRAAIEADYAGVRRDGFATCWNEMEIGFGAVAVPIDVPSVGPLYSVGVAGFIDRVKKRPAKQSAKQLQSAAAELARVLREPLID